MFAAHPTLRPEDAFTTRSNDPRQLCPTDRLFLTYNARGALYQLLSAIPQRQGNVVLLPAFHCTALVEPVAQSRFTPVFYRIKPDLSIDMADLRTKVTLQTAVVVVVHYFGFPTDLSEILPLCREAGCYLLEDCAHSFLTQQNGKPVGSLGDFSIYSFYKTVPSAVGGALRINASQFLFKARMSRISIKESLVLAKRFVEQLVDNSQNPFLKRRVRAFENRRVAHKKRLAPAKGAASQFLDDPYVFRKDLVLARIPALSRQILKSSDWCNTVKARRDNFAALDAALLETKNVRKLVRELPEDVCPWAYPILLENRPDCEQQLRARGVPFFTFGEKLHALLAQADSPMKSDAQELSRRLLALPVHQNLSTSEVASCAELVNQFFADAPLSADFVMCHGGNA